MQLKYILKIFLALFLFASCEEALEVSDPDSLSPDDVLDEVSGFESVLRSAYERVHDFTWYGQNAIVAPEILADNLDFNNRTGRYEDEYVNAVRAHMDRWARYIGINDANIVINRIDELRDLTADEQTLANQLKGEALFLRALNYHDMARVYGYEPGREENGFNLTVPLVLTNTEGVSDALDVKPRATNTEMYQQLETDIQEAISLLPASNPDAPFRVGKGAAHALLARVYLYAGRWADAAGQAELAMDNTSAGLITTKAGYYDAWSAIPHPESIYEAEIRSTDWSTVDGANNSLSTLSNNTSPSSQFILVASPGAVDAMLSEPGDLRDTIFTPLESIPAGTRKIEKWLGEKGDFLENIPVIRYSEVILIAAEGYARSGSEDQARSALNTFRAARGLPATTASGAALTDLIMKERRVEFIFEGQRWFDLKRLGMDIPKTASANVPDISYTDFRILADLPVSELNLNDMLVQNPGY